MADLDRLLHPKSVAVIGGGWAANVVAQCRAAGFQGEIWPVHPRDAMVAGHRAYPSLADLPAAPDAAWLGINRQASVPAVAELAQMGAGGTIAFASGFREASDGQDLEADLVRAAGEMPLLGPNCYGLLNYIDGAALWPDQHGGRRLAPGERGVAILAQSSNMAINLTMQRRGLPLSYVITVGNQAQLSLADIARNLLDNPNVSALGLHIEGPGDPAALERLAAEAREARVPLVALTIGKSAAAQAAGLSHTASLSGGAAAAAAFFRRIGVPRVDSLTAFLETLKLLHCGGPLSGRDVLSVSCSGGEAALMADSLAGHDLTLRPYKGAEAEALAGTLNDLVTIANPLDYHTFIWGDRDALQATFAAAMAPDFDLSLFVLDFPRADRCDPRGWEPTVEAIAKAAAGGSHRAAVVASLPEGLSEDRAEVLMAAGLVPLLGIPEALAAAQAAAELGEAWGRPPAAPILDPTAGSGTARALDEAESKARLAADGLPIPNGVIAGQGPLPDGPVAVKALGVAHKTEANAVRLNLTDAEDIAAAIAELAPLGQGVLVEQMVTGGVAEMLLGVSRDPVFGLTLTIAAGGILAELLSDRAVLTLPTTEAEIAQALQGLRLYPLLEGYRGAPPADLDAAISATMAVARYAETLGPRLEELDVNPLILCETGAWAADALICLRGEDD